MGAAPDAHGLGSQAAMLTNARLLIGVLCAVAACNLGVPQVPQNVERPGPAPQVEPPDPPPITDQDIVGTWVGTTVCRGGGSERTVELRLTIALEYIEVASCKTHVCEYTVVSGVLEQVALGDAGATVRDAVRARGTLAGRGVSLFHKDGLWGPSVHVLSGDVSMDGSTLSGGADDCGDFSLRKRTAG